MSNNGSILHGAPFVLVSKDLVVFVESVFVAEELLEEFHGLDCDFENKWSHLLHVFEQGFNTIQRHGNTLNLLRYVHCKGFHF